jgi:hypothetical protein
MPSICPRQPHALRARPVSCPPPLPPLAYPDRCEGRDVRANGGIRWPHHGGHVSPTCAGAYGGLEKRDDGVWNVDGGMHLGRTADCFQTRLDAAQKFFSQAGPPTRLPGVRLCDVLLGLRRKDELSGHSGF